MDDLAELLARFGERVAACEHCGCTTAWINRRELREHEAACFKILQGVEMEKSLQRKLEKKSKALKAKAAKQDVREGMGDELPG